MDTRHKRRRPWPVSGWWIVPALLVSAGGWLVIGLLIAEGMK